MPQAQIMTLDEKLIFSGKTAYWIMENRDKEGYIRLMKIVPMFPYLAKVMKENLFPNYLINDGWNLSEAEVKFG